MQCIHLKPLLGLLLSFLFILSQILICLGTRVIINICFSPLLVRRDSLLILDLGFDIFDGIRRLDLEGDGLARECFHEDLHLGACARNIVF